MNRKGEEIVEAAVVLPLVILTILSMIMVSVFLFDHHVKQTKAHISIMKSAASSGQVFGIKRGGASSSEYIRGTFKGEVSKSGSYRAYVISQADVIMLGELSE